MGQGCRWSFRLIPDAQTRWSLNQCGVSQTYTQLPLVKADIRQQDMRQISRVFNSLHSRVAFAKVDVKAENKIGFIYLDNPKNFNALTADMRASISKAIRDHEASSDVKVIVILSRVAKAFCAGADIKEFQGKSAKDFDNNDIFKELHDTLYSARKPILSGVNGVALGGGFELALLTDVIFAADKARFGLPELNLGLIPGIGGTIRLARIAGRVNANKFVFTSDMIPAKQAQELGVVADVFPNEELHEKVIEVAGKMVNKPLSALVAAKQAIKESENLSVRDAVALERKLFYPLYDTAGMKEGVDAFINKRAPKHTDL